MVITLDKKTVKLIDSLGEEGTIAAKIKKLLYNELVRRLNHYEVKNRYLIQKYRMDFASFKKKKIVQKKGYSFDVEQDLWDWEMSLDGIETVKKSMIELGK